jgi:hypothetical protein
MNKAIHFAKIGPRLKLCILNLTEHAQAKTFHLFDQHDDASAWEETRYARARAVQRRRDDARNEIARYENSEGDHREMIAALKEKVMALNAKLDKVNKETCPFTQIQEGFNRVLLGLGEKEQWVDAPVKPRMAKGETADAALKRTRTEIVRTDAEKRKLDATHKSRAEIERTIAEEVDRIARPPGFYLSGLSERGTDWPVNLVVEGDRAREVIDGAGLLAFAMRDQLVSALTAAAMKQHKGPGLSDAERRGRMAKLDAKLMALWREEEAIIEALEADGKPVARYFRFNGDRLHDRRVLMAVLGIESTRAARELEFG